MAVRPGRSSTRVIVDSSWVRSGSLQGVARSSSGAVGETTAGAAALEERAGEVRVESGPGVPGRSDEEQAVARAPRTDDSASGKPQ